MTVAAADFSTAALAARSSGVPFFDLRWRRRRSEVVHQRRRSGNGLQPCIGVDIAASPKADGPCTTLGSPLVSPEFAGYHVPVDRRQRIHTPF